MRTFKGSDKKGAGHRKVIPALSCVAVLSFSACGEAPTGGLFAGSGGTSGSVLETATLDQGTITLTPPAGYCIDGRSLKNRGARQFALLAQCDVLRQDETAGITSLTMLTVTAVRSGPDTPLPSAESIAETFGPATVLYDAVIDNVRVVQLSNGGTSATDQADPVHWRGVLQANDHTIGLAAYAMQDGSGAGLEGRNLLLTLARNIRGDSPGG
ncbi:hypothetical protein [Pseudooceanicola sp. MF1-13]|uniref:hypothetical protein n=1 Tax=Pseudooceanicola sp. MF1-13 TaxID=3379095 RepID=UPI0038917CD1